jgi:hypothetical protein
MTFDYTNGRIGVQDTKWPSKKVLIFDTYPLRRNALVGHP